MFTAFAQVKKFAPKKGSILSIDSGLTPIPARAHGEPGNRLYRAQGTEE